MMIHHNLILVFFIFGYKVGLKSDVQGSNPFTLAPLF